MGSNRCTVAKARPTSSALPPLAFSIFARCEPPTAAPGHDLPLALQNNIARHSPEHQTCDTGRDRLSGEKHIWATYATHTRTCRRRRVDELRDRI